MPREEGDMAEQEKKTGNPGSRQDQGKKVSDADLEKVSGGTAGPYTEVDRNWGGDADRPGGAPKPA